MPDTNTNNSANVSFGSPKATGAVFIAPLGTTIPTDATANLDASFKALGYVSEDGLVNGIETDTQDVKAWGGDTVLSGQTSFKETFTVNLIESSLDALKAYFGASNVTSDNGEVTVKVNSQPLPEAIIVFEIAMTGGRIKRIVIARGKFADRTADITYTDSDPISYPIKWVALPDSQGNTHIEYFALIDDEGDESGASGSSGA